MKIVNKVLLKKKIKKSKLLLLVCLNISNKIIQGIDNNIKNRYLIKYVKKNFKLKEINNLEINILKILDYRLYEFMMIEDDIFNDYDIYIKNISILVNKNILKNNFKIKQYINNEYIKIKYNVL